MHSEGEPHACDSWCKSFARRYILLNCDNVDEVMSVFKNDIFRYI